MPAVYACTFEDDYGIVLQTRNALTKSNELIAFTYDFSYCLPNSYGAKGKAKPQNGENKASRLQRTTAPPIYTDIVTNCCYAEQAE